MRGGGKETGQRDYRFPVLPFLFPTISSICYQKTRPTLGRCDDRNNTHARTHTHQHTRGGPCTTAQPSGRGTASCSPCKSCRPTRPASRSQPTTHAPRRKVGRVPSSPACVKTRVLSVQWTRLGGHLSGQTTGTWRRRRAAPSAQREHHRAAAAAARLTRRRAAPRGGSVSQKPGGAIE